MEPQVAQPAAQPQTPPSITQNFSPSTVALTKALGMAESGGKYGASDATGDNADSEGAYQMTPNFLQEWAPKAGVQYTAGMKLTPQQQDEIAGNAVQTMSTSGDPSYPELGKLSPAQIASAWNTGNPDAWQDPEYGKNNTYGSTENYVNKVAQYYNQEAAKNPQNQVNNATAGTPGGGQTADISQNQSSQPGWLTALEGLGLGGAGALLGMAKAPLEDAATGAVTGGLAGSILPGAGTLAGAGSGALAGLTEGVVQDVTGAMGGGNSQQTPTDTGSSQQQPQENTPNPIAQSSQASSLVQDAINETMQGTQSNRSFANSSDGKEAIQTASQFGLIQPDENGNLTFDDTKAKSLDAEIGNALDEQIKAEGGSASPVSAINYAATAIGNDKLQTATDRKKAAQYIQRFVSDDTGGVGMNGQVPLSSLREAQKAHYAAAANGYKGQRTNPEIMAHKALGQAYGRMIRDALPDKTLYDKTKRIQRNLINARTVGKRLNGKRAPTHVHPIWQNIVKRAALAAEAYIGDAIGGPIGGAISSVAGDWLNGKLDRHFSQNIFQTKSMKAALDTLRDTRPKEYDRIITALRKKGIKTPHDSENVSGSLKGKVKAVAKDVSRFSPSKGLVSLPKKNLPKATLASVNYNTAGVVKPDNQSESNAAYTKDTFQKLSAWYAKTGDTENMENLKKLQQKYETKGISKTEMQAMDDEYARMLQTSGENALQANMQKKPTMS
jgi:hypothetical protein